MDSILTGRRAALIVAVLAFTMGLICPPENSAQAPAITADGTLGTAVSRLGDAYTIDAGTIKGNNLFHSFSQFNVPTGGSATFIGPASTANVLSRVTGGQQSTIDGLISTRAAMPNANFYLINPSGVIFTSGASLDVGGAFRVSTADNIRLADGVVFSAIPIPGEAALLTSAPPQAFGFLSSAPAPITVEGAALVVDPGQTLSLVGGDVHISGATLLAPSGLIQIGSVASPGNATLTSPNLDLGSFPSLGQVTISDGAFVTAGTDFIQPGGTVSIRSGRLVVDGAVVTTDTFDLDGAPVGIDLNATESIALGNSAVVQTQSFGIGAASGISIATGHLEVKDAAVVQSLAFGTGPTGRIDVQAGSVDILNGAIKTSAVSSAAGDITITASDSVTVSGPAGEISTGTFALDPNILAGNISVIGENVTLSDLAKIRSGSLVEQAGQTLTVTANNSLTISGLAGISSQAIVQDAGTVAVSAQQLVMDAGYINTSTLGTGDAGTVAVNANTVSLTNGAQIASSSQVVATGAGGNISINAPGSVTISGVGPDDGVGIITFTNDPRSGIFSTASGPGNAGQIAVSTPTLTIADRGRISVATTGAGNAGSILANIGNFSLTGGAQVVSSTSEAGQGGNVTVTASNSVAIFGSGSGEVSGLFSTASSTGNAGEVTVSTPTLGMNNGGTISVATSGDGNAGNVSLNVNNLTLASEAQIVSSTSGAGLGGNISANATLSASISGAGTGLFSNASGTAPGGTINIQTAQLQITDGGIVSGNSTGDVNATAGNINVVVGDTLRIENGSITTEALVADGGNISITSTGSLVHLTNSQITSSVGEGRVGEGAGGDITIGSALHPFEFIVLNNSGIHANAFGGPGGNIDIFAGTLLSSVPIETAITASSALSTPGVIDIQATIVDVSGDVSQLPEAPLQATELLRASCAARLAGGKTSSLVLAGRGGLPLEPGGLLPSPLFSGAGPKTADYGPPRPSILGQTEEDLRLARVSNPLRMPSATLKCPS
jgi:filamentous hemagglutinin family protein